jgi:hypothetical protein
VHFLVHDGVLRRLSRGLHGEFAALLADADRLLQVSVVRDARSRNDPGFGHRLSDGCADPGRSCGARGIRRRDLRDGDERIRRVFATASTRQLHRDGVRDGILAFRSDAGLDRERRHDGAELLSRNRRRADAHSDAYADPHLHRHPDADSDADLHAGSAHRDSDSDADSNADSNADSDADSNADRARPDVHPDADSNADSDSDADSDADSHPDSDADADHHAAGE